jgi:hypothetical protein
MRHRALIAGLVLLASASACGRPDAGAILSSARTWRSGDEVPPALLEYRPRAAHVGMPTDSERLIGEIDNFELLTTLVASPQAPAHVVELAFERALTLAGPTRTFAALPSDAVPGFVAARTHEPSAWVFGVYVLRERVDGAEAEELLGAVWQRVEEGEALEVVYRDVYDDHRIPTGEGDAWLPAISNLGGFVVSDHKRDARPLREVEVPEHHLPAILGAKRGDGVMIADDDKVVLYQVLDQYQP